MCIMFILRILYTFLHLYYCLGVCIIVATYDIHIITLCLYTHICRDVQQVAFNYINKPNGSLPPSAAPTSSSSSLSPTHPTRNIRHAPSSSSSTAHAQPTPLPTPQPSNISRASSSSHVAANTVIIRSSRDCPFSYVAQALASVTPATFCICAKIVGFLPTVIDKYVNIVYILSYLYYKRFFVYSYSY